MSLSQEMELLFTMEQPIIKGPSLINNANFKVNGLIDEASIFVCRNIGFSSQRGTLSGSGNLDRRCLCQFRNDLSRHGGTLTLGSLTLNSADLVDDTLGSLVYIEINSSGTSLVVRYRSRIVSRYLGDRSRSKRYSLELHYSHFVWHYRHF